MALDRINATALLDGGVTTTDIADDAVTTAKLATQTGNVDFADGGRIRLGDSQDLQIYHNGNNSYIDDTGTGNLYIRASDTVRLQSATGEQGVIVTTDGAVTLYHDNGAKLATAATGMDVSSTDATVNFVSSRGTGATHTITTGGANSGNFNINAASGGDIYVNAENKIFRNAAGSTEHMRIDSSGSVGIGTTSPTDPLTVIGSATIGNTTVAPITTELHVHSNVASSPVAFGNETSVVVSTNTTPAGNQGYIGSLWFGSQDISAADQYGWKLAGMAGYMAGDTSTSGGSADLLFYTASGSQTGTERMRIDDIGRVGIGEVTDASLQSGNNTGNSQFYWQGNYGVFASDNDVALICNRQNSADGPIIALRKNGATIGNIGTNGSSRLSIGSGDTGIDFESSTDAIRPCSGTGAARDNVIDLGRPDVRFDDIFATNGTIQTSDANEKQQIAALTDAEITAAKTISTLFKTYKWNSAVESKGDAARTHTGVVAQDVQAAMTAAGLDAGDYAFFTSNTWWETQTEVPAVEADEENGVEAQEAYTRTDTYDTAEEAPDGATERTRMGIRYPELLAFVGAATEQRLGNIETRLEALENA